MVVPSLPCKRQNLVVTRELFVRHWGNVPVSVLVESIQGHARSWEEFMFHEALNYHAKLLAYGFCYNRDGRRSRLDLYMLLWLECSRFDFLPCECSQLLAAFVNDSLEGRQRFREGSHYRDFRALTGLV